MRDIDSIASNKWRNTNPQPSNPRDAYCLGFWQGYRYDSELVRSNMIGLLETCVKEWGMSAFSSEKHPGHELVSFLVKKIKEFGEDP